MVVEDRGVREWVSRYMVREMANAASGESTAIPRTRSTRCQLGCPPANPAPEDAPTRASVIEVGTPPPLSTSSVADAATSTAASRSRPRSACPSGVTIATTVAPTRSLASGSSATAADSITKGIAVTRRAALRLMATSGEPSFLPPSRQNTNANMGMIHISHPPC